MLTIKVDDRAVQAWLTAMPEKVRQRLEQAVYTLAEKLRSHIIQDKLLGQVLNRRNGGLGQSIQQKVDSTSTSVVGTVYSAGDVKYAAIHEFGGVINHPGGTAFYVSQLLGGRAFWVSNASALADKLPRTAAHQITMPERSYMRSSLADMKDDIIQKMTLAVNEGTKP